MIKENKEFGADMKIELINDGPVTIWMDTKNKEWFYYKEIVNKVNQSKGYNVILIEKKQYMRSKLIAHAYLNISLDDKTIYICHEDEDKLNCSVQNLIIKKKNWFI